MILPFPPGGGTDVIARIVAAKLVDRLGVSVVVDNRGGANGILATEIAAKAPADGYTLLAITAGHVINPALYRDLPFDAVRDFAPVGGLATGGFALVVHPSVRASSVNDLLALARSSPGGLTYSSSGAGSPNHLAGEMLTVLTGAGFRHVPYKGAGPAVGAVLSGEVAMSFGTLVTVPAMSEAKKLRVLAVTAKVRSATLPDVPTMIESGIAGFEVTTWFGVLAPARTPSSAVGVLNEHISGLLKSPDVSQRLSAQALEPMPMSSNAFGDFLRSEAERWRGVVRAAGVKPAD